VRHARGALSSPHPSHDGHLDVPRSLKRLLFTLIITVALTGASSGDAHAEAPEIETHYSAGKAALKSGKLDDALNNFKAALALCKGDEGRTWQMLLAVALTYRERNEPQYAIEYYRRFLKQTKGQLELMPLKWKNRRKRATADLEQLERDAESTHGFVSVVTAPPGAKVLIDGRQGGADADAVSPHGTTLVAGEHAILIELPGYAPYTQTLTVRAGGAHPIKVTLTRRAPITPEPATIVAPTEPTAPALATPSTNLDGAVSTSLELGDPAPQWGPWVTIGAASAMAITGVAMSVMASEANKTAEGYAAADTPVTDAEKAQWAQDWEQTISEVQTYQLTAGVLYGAALAAATGGIVWMLLTEPESPRAASFSVTPTPGGAYGAAAWSF
jgi:tetratricopeptide (TPR) repeat protein